MKRGLLWVAVLAVLAVAAAFVYVVTFIAPIADAYTAKMLCSGVFVAHRPADDVLKEDILADNNPLLPLVDARVDMNKRRVDAAFLHLARRESVYREGIGCVIAIHSAPDGLAAESRPMEPSPSTPLPCTSKSEPNVERLRAVVDRAFTEPDPAKLRRTRAVVVLRDSQILAEGYAAGFTANTPQIGWSMSKTVTAILVGILVGEGRLSIDRSHLLPEWQADGRASIALDQLLHMSSGLDFDESYGNPRSDVVRMIYETGDAAQYAAARPLINLPGSVYKYASGTTQILSRIVRDAFHGDDQAYRAFPRKALFAPLGMQHATLEMDESGTFSGASFVYAGAHDWARLGILLMNDGVWQDQRILPEGWVRYMTAPAPAAPLKNYGAHVWLKIGAPYNSLAAIPPGLPAGTFHLIGHDAQFVSIVPSLRLVVVRLGLSRIKHSWDQETFLASVIAALEP